MGLRGRNNGNVNVVVVGIIRELLLWVYEVEIKGIAYDGGGGLMRIGKEMCMEDKK